MAWSGGPTLVLVNPEPEPITVQYPGQPPLVVQPGQAFPEAAAAQGVTLPAGVTVSHTHSGLGTFGQALVKVVDVFTYGAASAYLGSDPELKQAYYGGTEYNPPPPGGPWTVAQPASQPPPEPLPVHPSIIARLLGQLGGTMNGVADPWAEFWVDPYAAGEWASSVSPYQAADYTLEASLRGLMGGTGYDDYSAPLPPGYLQPGEVQFGLEQLPGLLGGVQSVVRTVAGLLGGSTATPGMGPMGAPLGMAAGVLGGLGRISGGGGGMALGALVPALTTAVGRITATRAWSLVRRNGLTAVATALGIGAAELAQWLMANPPRRRRRRGVSARDIRTTKRVVRFACGITDALRNVKARKRIC